MRKTFFPNNLKSLPVWILWKLEEDSKGRLTKVPYSAQYDGRASSINPGSWSSYNEAVSKYEANRTEYSGIGIMISKEYRLIFLDCDHCIDPSGVFDDRASEIIDLCGGRQFIEKSQSGTGIHLITFGEIPRSFKNSSSGIEMYSEKRFCAMTGDALFENEMTEDDSLIGILFEKYKTQERSSEVKQIRSGSVSLGDEEIIKKAQSREGKFKILYSGRWEEIYSSQSEADLSLCMILAFWCDRDYETIDRIFRSSGLFRDKWNRKDYREKTILTACANIGESVSEYVDRKQREERRDLESVFITQW